LLLHSLLGNRRTKHIAQQRLTTLGVEPTRAGRRMQGEPIKRAALVMWFLLMPPMFIYLAGEGDYGRTGLKNPVQIFAARIPRVVKGAAGLSIQLTAFGLVGVAFFSARRFGRSEKVARRKRKLTNAMFLRDTAQRSFWAKPDIADLLLPARDPDSPAKNPTSSGREMASAISLAFAKSPGNSRPAVAQARDAAAALSRAVERLDQDIASLAAGMDATEIDRLVEKIAALGTPTSEEGAGKRQMRDLFQKQLDLLGGLGARVEELKKDREKRFALLRSLWQEVVGLGSVGGDPDVSSRARTQIATLCAEAGALEDPSPATSSLGPDLTDSPTMERTEPSGRA